jgi:hypothetical protein
MHLVVFLGTLMLSCSPFCRRAAAQRRWRKPPVCMASQLRRACKWSGQLRTGAPLLCTHCCSQLAAFCCRNWGPLDGASLHVPCAKNQNQRKKHQKKSHHTEGPSTALCTCRQCAMPCDLPEVHAALCAHPLPVHVRALSSRAKQIPCCNTSGNSFRCTCRPRLADLTSSHLHTRMLHDQLESIGPADVFARAEYCDDLAPPLHEALDRKLGL